ncbi:type-F conjugative transfer system secretin TraK [Aeromonas caviae]
MRKVFVLAMAICSPAIFAVTPVTFTEGKPVTIGISRDEPNFISFTDDRIAQLSVPGGMIEHSIDTDTGELMIIPTESGALEKKISALVTTENGIRLRVSFQPRQGEPAEVILSPSIPPAAANNYTPPVGTVAAQVPKLVWGKEFSSEKEAALGLAQEMVRFIPSASRLPDGVEMRVMDTGVKTALPDGFDVRLTQLWLTTALVGEKLDIVNKGTVSLPLHERQLNASSGVGVYVDAPMYLMEKDAFMVPPKHHITAYRIRRN